MQVETDERGGYSHGTRALPGYVRSIIKGEINPKPAPRVLTEAPATALIDADNSLGHVAGEYAMKMAIEKADATGLAAVAVRNSNHYGAATCFAMMALPAKLIGFSTTRSQCGTIRWLLRSFGESPHRLCYSYPSRTANCA